MSTDYLSSAFAQPLNRRQLIKSVAVAGAATWVTAGPAGAAVAAERDRRPRHEEFTDFRVIPPSSADELQLPRGFTYDVLLTWGEEFGEGLRFGYNCDYTDYFPVARDEALLWVNHEYLTPYFTSDWLSTMDPQWDPRVEPYRSIMKQEKEEVGGSIVHIERVRRGERGPWRVVKGSRYNRRFTAAGPLVPYDGPAASLLPEAGAAGSLANCSGGHTPWGTVISAEENYQSYGLQREMPFALGWDRGNDPNYYVGEPGTNAYGQPAEEQPNYGYLLEVDPYTGRAVKHTALGRLHHENATMRIARDGRVVAYTGDDAPSADGMLFKFVSKRRWRPGMSRREGMRLLSSGQLYVAQFLPTSNDPAVDRGTGMWHPLDMRDPQAAAYTTKWVQENIVAQVGGTLDQFQVPRAEDCELVPRRPRDLLVALTSAAGLPADRTAYGVVRLLRERSEDPDSTEFRWVNLLEGGQHTGIASPDNLEFSGVPAGHALWLTTDISTSRLNVPGEGYEWHGNNALYYVPLSGMHAQTAFRFANAPIGAELTGPTFVNWERTLFLSVQHPGENTPLDAPIGPDSWTSWWPHGNKTAGTNPSKPRPSVVAIRRERARRGS